MADPLPALPDDTEARQALISAVRRGTWRSAIDVVFDGIAQGVRRVFGVRISWWMAALGIWGAGLLLCGVVALATGRAPAFSQGIWSHIGVLGLGVCTWVTARVLLHKFLETLCAEILVALDHPEDLAKIRKGLAQIFHVRRQLIFAVMTAGPLAIPLLLAPQARDSAGGLAPEFVATSLLNGLLSGTALFYAFTAFPFLSLIGRFRFRLYRADPANSEVIDVLSDTTLSVLYTFAALFVVGTFVFGRLGLIAGEIGLISTVFITWVPLLVVFFGAQRTFAQIIQGAKWRTLSELQAQIHSLEASEPILSPNTLEHLGKLMDHHDRVRDTRETAVDLRSWVGFFNALLLPVLAFGAANAELVWSWVLAHVVK